MALQIANEKFSYNDIVHCNQSKVCVLVVAAQVLESTAAQASEVMFSAQGLEVLPKRQISYHSFFTYCKSALRIAVDGFFGE